MRVLISFYAFNNDFLNDGTVKKDGPTMEFHQHWYNYDKHLLLGSSDEKRLEELRFGLQIKFPEHQVETYNLDIPVEQVVNLEYIYARLFNFIQEHTTDDDEVVLFFSPGTSIMQVAWFLIHHSGIRNTRLVQTIAAKHTQDAKPRIEEVVFEQADTLYILNTIQQGRDGKSKKIESAYNISPSIENIYQLAKRVAQTDVRVLIYGDTGTGKEHLARYIVEHSLRKNQPFITINCSAFPDQLLESQIFGHKKSSFTGATQDYKGIFEQVHHGTVFLDEIGDISPYMQQSLLRFLQSGEIQPLGGGVKKVDVRVLAATNRNLLKMVQEGTFRSDLYYRLSVVEFTLPTLQERGAHEVEELLDFFIKSKQKLFKRKQKLVIAPAVRAYIVQYPFRGNVRELEALVENLYALYDEVTHIEDLPAKMRETHEEIASMNLEIVKKKHIEKVLQYFQGNLTKAAEALGIAVNTLKKYHTEGI